MRLVSKSRPNFDLFDLMKCVVSDRSTAFYMKIYIYYCYLELTDGINAEIRERSFGFSIGPLRSYRRDSVIAHQFVLISTSLLCT